MERKLEKKMNQTDRPDKINKELNPGTQEAIDAGCTCPVMDNEHGAGYMGMEDVFVYTVGCPVHKEKKDETE